MKIGIDLDDVTVAILDGLTAFHNTHYNTNFSVDDHTQWDLDKTWNCTPQEAMKRVYDFYRSPAMDYLEPIDGAVSGIEKLYKNHSLTFITSRPSFTEEKTKKWLKKYFPKMDIPVHFTNQFTPTGEVKQKKSDICKLLAIPLIIDDGPFNVADCTIHNIRVMLYTRPWNKNIQENDLIVRVNSWKEIEENF